LLLMLDADRRAASQVLSSWAAKLGFSSPSTAAPPQPLPTPPAGPGAAPLQDTSRQARQLAGASAGQLFARPQASMALVDALGVFFERWPPNSRNPRALSLLNAAAFGFPLVELGWLHAEAFPRALAFRAFALAFSHLLLVTDEEELYDDTWRAPLPRAAVERAVRALNGVLAAGTDDCTRLRVGRLLAQLYDAHSRRPLTRPDAWLLPGAEMVASESGVRAAFWQVRFSGRARFFADAIQACRLHHQPPDEPPPHRLQVRRKALLQDAFVFFQRPLDWRKRVYVEFVNVRARAKAAAAKADMPRTRARPGPGRARGRHRRTRAVQRVPHVARGAGVRPQARPVRAGAGRRRCLGAQPLGGRHPRPGRGRAAV
jgi:hypothetical protein